MAIIRIPLNLPLTIHSFTHSFILSFTPSFIQFEVWLVRIDSVSEMSPKSGHTHSDGHKIPVIPTSNDGHAARIEESHILHGLVFLWFSGSYSCSSLSLYIFFLSPDRFNRSFSTEMSVLIPDSGKFDLHAYEQKAKKRKEHYYLMNSIGYLCQCVFSPRFDIISFLLALYAMTQRYLSTELVQFWRNRSSHTTSIEWMEDKGKTNSTYNTHYGAFLSSSIIHDTHTHRECPFECFRPTPKCINT